MSVYITVFHYLTLCSAFLPAAYFYMLLRKFKKIDEKVFLLGVLIIYGIITEIISFTLVFGGVAFFKEIQDTISVFGYRGDLIKSIGFVVINKSIVNLFIYSYYTLVELYISLYIILSWKEYSTLTKIIITSLISLTVLILNYKHFDVGSMDISSSFLMMENAIVIIVGLWAFASSKIKNISLWKKPDLNIFLVVVLYNLLGVFTNMYYDLKIAGVFYFKDLSDIFIYLLFFLVIYRYKKELLLKY